MAVGLVKAVAGTKQGKKDQQMAEWMSKESYYSHYYYYWSTRGVILEVDVQATWVRARQTHATMPVSLVSSVAISTSTDIVVPAQAIPYPSP
jgi:hypothetical protein